MAGDPVAQPVYPTIIHPLERHGQGSRGVEQRPRRSAALGRRHARVPRGRRAHNCAALTIVLPTGNAACGLGNGVTSEGLDIGFGASPNAKLHVSADASRSLSHASSQST